MKLTDKQYNFLKWFVGLFLPSFTTFIGVLGQSLGWQDVNTYITILSAFTAFLGAITGISTYNYNQANKGAK